MNYFLLSIAIVAGYFFIVFVLLRLVAPYMGFRPYPLPVEIPGEMKSAILNLENQTQDQNSYLEAVYRFVLGRWEHSRLKAGLLLPKLFKKDLTEIWHTKGFVYCTSINFIVYVLLAKSKYFTAQDVKIRHVFLNFVPHQYLQVRIGEKWVDVDPAGAGIRNQPLGTHASFFG